MRGPHRNIHRVRVTIEMRTAARACVVSAYGGKKLFGRGGPRPSRRPAATIRSTSRRGRRRRLGRAATTSFFGGALDANDRGHGGEGNDTLVLQGNYPALYLHSEIVTGIEGLSLQSGSITRWGQSGANSYDYVVTTSDANVASGQQLRVNAQSLLAGEDFTLNGGAEMDGRFLVYGGHGAEQLTGGAGNDIFFFEAGRLGAADRIVGGGGSDAVVISGAAAGALLSSTIAAGTLSACRIAVGQRPVRERSRLAALLRSGHRERNIAAGDR